MKFGCCLAALLLTSIPYSAMAATVTGYRLIAGVGCHTVNNICYFSVSGGDVGPNSCLSTSIRWNSETTPNGKVLLAQITAAYLAGKRVEVVLADTCYEGFPIPLYYNVAE